MNYATINDLKRLCDKLIVDGLGEAELGLNDEYSVTLKDDGNIAYTEFTGAATGKKFVDIQP